MRKIVAGLLISLDGVVESPNKWGWQQYMDAEMTEGIVAGVAQADAVLMGRRTYLDFAAIWPKQGIDVPMARFLNSSPKYVASTTLDTLAWQPAILIKEDLAGELTKLRQQRGKNILIPGSPRLARALLIDGLLDELSLNICPVVVGSGLRLFDDVTGSVSLKLVASKTFSNGVLSVTYQHLPGVPRGSEPPVSFPQAAAR
jgi:dihydrofolate reductase